MISEHEVASALMSVEDTAVIFEHEVVSALMSVEGTTMEKHADACSAVSFEQMPY